MPKPETQTVVTYWLKEIDAARQREKDFRKDGAEIIKIYEATDEDKTPFNILYSNTETLRPALFSAQPRPVVMRRFKDDDPIGKMASDAGRRVLEFFLDTNREDYETVSDAMGAGVLDSLLPGRGMVALKYEADFVEIPEKRPPESEDIPKGEQAEQPAPAEYATNEMICPESLIWDRVYMGYAKKWVDVPWLAYEFFMTKAQVASRFGKDVAGKLTYTTAQTSDREDKDKADKDEEGARRTACIYQIWDKAGGKKVYHIAASYTDKYLKEEDDPLQLTGFFNTPRPLMFVEKTTSLVPTAPYQMYRNQAAELNELTRRINKLAKAIKARGGYDGALGDTLGKILESDENALVPVESASSLATEKGFQNAIWMLPVEQLIAVLIQLYQARESCKQVIYEITGISDIIRGATKASETAAAQQLKSQWGTLRLKRMQNEVARYVRDLLRMMLELAATKFSVETWAKVTGLPFMTMAQREQLQMQAQMLMQTGQQLPPELQAQISQPVWEQILEVLRDDAQRTYRIDIETNSTVEPEAAEDQKHINELLGMLGQLLNGLGPLVVKGVMPFEAVQSFLLFVVRRFRMGSEIEDYIKQMQPPKPEDDGKQAEQQLQAAQQQIEQQKQQAMQDVQMKQKQAEMALQEKAMQEQMRDKEREMQLKMREMELALKEKELALQLQAERNQFQLEKQHAANEMKQKEQMMRERQKAQPQGKAK